MFDGFLGTRASFMFDFVFVALLALVPILGWSVYEVKYRRRYELHKRVQTVLTIVLLAAVAAFETDIQLTERMWPELAWEHRANPAGPVSSSVTMLLWIHLVFAVSTAVLWPVVLVRALRNFPDPALPGEHSRWHLRWAKIAAVDLLLTALTGWGFYWLAFVGGSG